MSFDSLWCFFFNKKKEKQRLEEKQVCVLSLFFVVKNFILLRRKVCLLPSIGEIPMKYFLKYTPQNFALSITEIHFEELGRLAPSHNTYCILFRI